MMQRTTNNLTRVNKCKKYVNFLLAALLILRRISYTSGIHKHLVSTSQRTETMSVLRNDQLMIF